MVNKQAHHVAVISECIASAANEKIKMKIKKILLIVRVVICWYEYLVVKDENFNNAIVEKLRDVANHKSSTLADKKKHTCIYKKCYQ